MSDAIKKSCDYDYSTKEAREKTIATLFATAKDARAKIEEDWKVYENFYNGKHDVDYDNDEDNFRKSSINDEIGITDAYKQIESQIDTTLPECIFKGREKSDTNKAKQREYVVKSIIYKNSLEDKLTKNERNMRKLGDAFIKVYFDNSANFDGNNFDGDIVIDCINTEDIYPDASAEDINSCEYIDYVYKIHKRKAIRIYGHELKKLGMSMEDIAGSCYVPSNCFGHSITTDEVEVMEHWYRDDDGDIAFSILINGKEVRHVDKYWEATGSQNKNYPFVQFYRIRNNNSFWNNSELKAIIPLIKTGDKILQNSLKNMDYNANDMIIVEDNSLQPDEEITNEAGAIIHVKQGTGGTAVRRVGGINKLGEFIGDIQFIQSEIQKTCRNYDTNNGADTTTQNTASGLAMLRADAAAQSSIKDADRLNGFKRLFQLIDWTALEFYDNDRLIYIGTPNKNNRADMIEDKENFDSLRGDIFFTFSNSKVWTEKTDRMDGYIQISHYFPAIDVEVNATTGLQKSKTYTIQALQAILQTQVTQANYKIVVTLIRELGIPQGEEIIQNIEQMYSPNRGSGNSELDKYISQLTPQQQATLRNNPSLMNQLNAEYTKTYGGTQYSSGDALNQ